MNSGCLASLTGNSSSMALIFAIDQLADVAATLAKAAPDVVFCVGDPAIRAARQYTIPIVALSPEMVAVSFVRSLSRSSGNFTGVSVLGAELNGKRLDILMDVVPGARRNSSARMSGSARRVTPQPSPRARAASARDRDRRCAASKDSGLPRSTCARLGLRRRAGSRRHRI
jgi:hypothetical protein